MNWLLAMVLSCLGTEIFLHLPIARSTAQTLSSCAQAGRIILSPAISDHWKEKVMRAYALRMARQSLLLTGCFAILTAAVAAALFLMAGIEPDVAAFVASLTGLTFSLAESILYYQARRQFARP